MGHYRLWTVGSDKAQRCLLRRPAYVTSLPFSHAHQAGFWSPSAHWAVQFCRMCSDPLHYMSAMVDGQTEDYSALPCNDPELVDQHVYEMLVD